MSSQGLLDGATSELFKTYEADYHVTYSEAQQKLTQIRDLDGGELSADKPLGHRDTNGSEEPRHEAMKAVEKATDECIEIVCAVDD
jgi:vesicle transport through interaction with t-SNAREs protein 1